jgi:hypothetical protein
MEANQVTALALLLLAILRGTDGATGKFLSSTQVRTSPVYFRTVCCPESAIPIQEP